MNERNERLRDSRLGRLILRVGIPVAVVMGAGALAFAGVPHSFNNGDTLQATDLNSNFSALDQRIAALEAKPVAPPPGTVITFAGTVIPDGWLLCDGRNVKRADYPALFGAIGVVYGPGDSITSFALPNLMQRFLMGTSADKVGATGGLATVDATHTHAPGTLAVGGGDHFHDLPFGDSGSGLGWNRNYAGGAAFTRDLRLTVFDAGGNDSVTAYRATGGAHTHTISGATGAGGGATQENRPPYLGLLPLIRF